MQAPRKEVDGKIVYMCYRPAFVEVLWCWSHTAAAGLSSGSHVSDADGVSHSSVSCPPERQTARNKAENTLRFEHKLDSSDLYQSFLTEGLTCLIFSLSCSGVPVPVIRRLFLNIAIRVLASLRWILGSRALSCACLFFISSISLWL